MSLRIEPFATGRIDVGDGHSLYVESVGRAGAMPAVYLHGGPGSGCAPDHRRLFDISRHHAVLFDQRGAGRSTPRGSRIANTTAHLIADMESIRAHFGFEKWMIVGGSWGATLAIAYARAYPDRVLGLVLRAVFLGTRTELDQAFRIALPGFYPALSKDFLGLLPPSERAAPLDAYFRRILDPDPDVHVRFARAWYETERTLSEVRPPRARLDLAALERRDALPSTPFMEAHYFQHDCFLTAGELMRDAPLLEGIPGIIVQGRYDLLCPPTTSHALAAQWKQAEVRIVDCAGHSLHDPGVRDAVAHAVSEMTARIMATVPEPLSA